MSQRVLLIAGAGVAVISILLWLLMVPAPRTPVAEELPLDAPPTPTPAPEQRVMLLFVGADGMLHPELRSAPLPDEVHERIKTVMAELLAGPSNTDRYRSPVPYEAELRAVFVDSRGNAYVDLTPPPKPLTGSSTEIMLAYGVVDSIILNCPEVTAVQILFGGREVQTLTGHLDLSKPLVLNKRFVGAS